MLVPHVFQAVVGSGAHEIAVRTFVWFVVALRVLGANVLGELGTVRGSVTAVLTLVRSRGMHHATVLTVVDVGLEDFATERTDFALRIVRVTAGHVLGQGAFIGPFERAVPARVKGHGFIHLDGMLAKQVTCNDKSIHIYFICFP